MTVTYLVVEAILNGRANAKVAAESALRCLSEDVSTRVPEDLLALGVVEGQKLELDALLKRALQIPKSLLGCAVVETSNDGAFEQALADVARNIGGAGDPRLALNELAVFECDGDFL